MRCTKGSKRHRYRCYCSISTQFTSLKPLVLAVDLWNTLNYRTPFSERTISTRSCRTLSTTTSVVRFVRLKHLIELPVHRKEASDFKGLSDIIRLNRIDFMFQGVTQRILSLLLRTIFLNAFWYHSHRDVENVKYCLGLDDTNIVFMYISRYLYL